MKNNDYKIIPVKTGYIKPDESYDIIIENSKDLLEDEDFLVISETPIAISQGRLVDEALFKPSLLSIFLQMSGQNISGVIYWDLFLELKKEQLKI